MTNQNTRRGANLFHRTLKGDERGAALVVALLMLLGLAAMGMAAIMISSTDFVVAGNQRQNSIALNVAEGGLAEAIHRLGLQPGSTVNVGGTDIDASIFDPADPPDPNWAARIFLTAPDAAPAAVGNVLHTGTLQAAGEYLPYASATDPAEAILITHKLRDFDGDGTNEVTLYDPSRVPPENPQTGFPVERIQVRGLHGQSQRAILADVIRFPINPSVFSALQADGEVDLRGNVTVCGHNHRMETPPGTQLPNCSPAWDEATGHLYAVMTTGGTVGTRGSTDLLGSPSPTSTSATNSFRSLAESLGLTAQELQEILSRADRNDLSGPQPWTGITHIQGNASINGGTGEGLLYVEGDLRISGTFQWTGLIYVEGQFRNTGDCWVLGGVMARGGGNVVAVDFGAGTPAILYSRAALIQALTAAMDYVVLTWKEI